MRAGFRGVLDCSGTVGQEREGSKRGLKFGK